MSEQICSGNEPNWEHIKEVFWWDIDLLKEAEKWQYDFASLDKPELSKAVYTMVMSVLKNLMNMAQEKK